MKSFQIALFASALALGASAEGNWLTTLAKAKGLVGETGIAGFARREAPAYITGNFAEADRPAAPQFDAGRRLRRDAFANRNGLGRR